MPRSEWKWEWNNMPTNNIRLDNRRDFELADGMAINDKKDNKLLDNY